MKSPSRIIVWLVFATMALTSLVRNEVFTGQTNVINWDGYGYYAYLPATFIYGDVSELAFAEEHFENYAISDQLYQLMETPTGQRFPIYNLGLAVVWTPGFLLAHAFCKLTDLAPADGMSFPYQLSVVLTSLLLIFLGLWYLRRFLLCYLEDPIVALTLLGLGLGTNLFYYLVEGPDMTHAYLFTGYALFLWRFRVLTEKETLKNYLWAGLLAGLMCLIRSSEIVLFAIPALYGLRDWSSFKVNFRRTVLLFFLALSVFSLQLFWYKIGTGTWFRDGYAGLGFDWFSPHLYEGFFGYRRGWLVYTPLLLFGLLGIGWLRRGWLLPVLGFTVANCYLLFSWHIWWYGDTFGSRPVVQSYAVLGLALGALFGAVAGAKWVTTEPASITNSFGWKNWGLLLFLLCFCCLNLFQHWQYNQRILPLDFINKTYYWHVFGKTSLNKKDRVLLDTNEQLPDQEWRSTTLLQTDTSLAVPPKAQGEFTNLLEYRLTEQDLAQPLWLRANVRFSYYGESYDKWKFPGLITEVRREKETLKWVQVKIPPVLETPELDSIAYAISLPDAAAGDLVKVYVWNLCQDSMLLRRLDLALLRE